MITLAAVHPSVSVSFVSLNFRRSALFNNSQHLPFSDGRARNKRAIECSCSAVISRDREGASDPELRTVLELATDSELYELESILFGPSYFSPLLKSIADRRDVDYMYGGRPQERDDFIELLESRFLYLAADARSTLRGWRPSYRNVLLAVRSKLKIPCSNKLSTEDLEAEIFLHLLHEFSSEEAYHVSTPPDEHNYFSMESDLQLGLVPWKVRAMDALKVGAEELRSMLLKGGSIFTLGQIYHMIARRLSGKMFLEAANYQIKREILKKGGQLATINLESRAALLAARQGFTSAASRYLGLRSIMMLLGPVLWGTFLADVVIQMIGTDYARILRAIYAFAQIRLTRTYNWTTTEYSSTSKGR
ncbi:hypothetical protein H6P81_002157 [Aristolochia fimbriata]|uniref:Uncharacterized protein n=1 Tax=Aristolochia fimbriata TaxID=158543 RepID=A0AAV7F9K7_ARIFI|nr:hypothetical protein H6P81_002157 [Aristolochia fimbriata]